MIGNMHPAWKVCIGLAVLIFITIATGGRVLLLQQEAIEGIKAQQNLGQERSYINRAIGGCSDIINDGEIEITEECMDERVAAYYPPSICEKLPRDVPNCGSKAVVVTELGDVDE